MSKLTVYMALLCAVVLFALSSAPASALQGDGAPRVQQQCAARAAAAPAADAAKVRFLRSLAQQLGAKPGAPQRSMETKAARVECTSDGPVTTCCGPCGCCTWWPNGSGPNCKSNC